MNGSLPTDPVFGAGNQVVTLIEGPRTPNSVPAWCEVAGGIGGSCPVRRQKACWQESELS